MCQCTSITILMGVNMQECLIKGGGVCSIHWTIVHTPPPPPNKRNHSQIHLLNKFICVKSMHAFLFCSLFWAGNEKLLCHDVFNVICYGNISLLLLHPLTANIIMKDCTQKKKKKRKKERKKERKRDKQGVTKDMIITWSCLRACLCTASFSGSV